MEKHDHELRFAENDELVTLILEPDCPRCAEIAEWYAASQN